MSVEDLVTDGVRAPVAVAKIADRRRRAYEAQLRADEVDDALTVETAWLIERLAYHLKTGR